MEEEYKNIVISKEKNNNHSPIKFINGKENENENKNTIKTNSPKKEQISNTLQNNYNKVSIAIKNNLLKDKNNNNLENKTINNSTTIENHEISGEIVEPLTSNNRYKKKETKATNKKQSIKQGALKTRKTQDFNAYYKRMIDYRKNIEERLIRQREELENIELRELRKKPYLSEKTQEIIKKTSKNENLFQRMKENEKKTKEKIKRLTEIINQEREKKKAEQDKPLEFKTKLNPIDKKFNIKYMEMKRKQLQTHEDFLDFASLVKDYENRECVFQPNLKEKSKNKNKTVNSEELIQRLYDDEIKKKKKLKENLDKKYKPSFKPNINDTSIDLAKKWKERRRNQLDKSLNYNNKSAYCSIHSVTKRINNSETKRKIKKKIIEADNKSVDKKINEKIKKTEVKKNNSVLDKSKNDIINNSIEEHNNDNLEMIENKEEKDIKLK